MKVELIRIGNSKGIRIPASVIRECELEGELELRVENGVIVLSPVRRVRTGWAGAFERMSPTGDDALLVPDVFEDEAQHADWTW